MKKSHNKLRGERELANYLQPVVDKCYQPQLRNLRLNKAPRIDFDPYEEIKGGLDVIGLDWLSFLIKFDGRNNFEAWWPELLKQTAKDQEPVLFYRSKQTQWFAMMKMYSEVNGKKFFTLAHVPITHFLIYFEYRLKLELEEKVKVLDLINQLNSRSTKQCKSGK